MYYDNRLHYESLLSDAEALTPKFQEEPKLNFDYAYTVGIDLGRLRDKSVITTVMSKTVKGKTHHVVCDIQELTAGLDFPTQCKAIVEYHDRPHFRTWPCKTLIDNSGLGLAVCDWLQADYPDFKFQRVTITAGEKHNSRNWLIRNTLKWMAKPNFFISKDVPGWEELKEQILSVKMDKRASGAAFFETATSFDDHLMSLALCLSALESRSQTIVTDIFFGKGPINKHRERNGWNRAG